MSSRALEPSLTDDPRFIELKKLQMNGASEQAFEIGECLVREFTQHALLFNEMGILSIENGKTEKSLFYFEQALLLEPQKSHYHTNMAHALLQAGDRPRALRHFLLAAELSLSSPKSLYALALEILDLGDKEQAQEYLEVAYSLSQDEQTACALAKLYWEKAQRQKAIALVEQASKQAYPHLNTLGQLAKFYFNNNQLDQSAQVLQRILKTDRIQEASYYKAEHNLGMIFLTQGHFEKGFNLYESRLNVASLAGQNRHFLASKWSKEDLKGKTILVHTEQGDGDNLQFARYLPLLKHLGATVIVESYPWLAPLLRTLSSIDQLIDYGAQAPHYDFYCPLLSLPCIFQSNLNNLPSPCKFQVDPSLREKWRQPIERLSLGKSLKVGFVWAGSPKHANDAARSLSFNALKPLFEKKEATFFSLQKGKACDQLIKASDNVVDLGANIKDWEDTAAIIENIDLVICPDTALAHLSASLGKPTWILIASPCDWRWFEHRLDSPWYPSVRLFRQKTPQVWPEVVQEAAHALKNFR
jgi:tetratricopeptide (TPR) repeat protein